VFLKLLHWIITTLVIISLFWLSVTVLSYSHSNGISPNYALRGIDSSGHVLVISDNSKESFDWTPVITSGTSIIVFFLNYFFIYKKDKKYKKLSSTKEDTVAPSNEPHDLDLAHHPFFSMMKEVLVIELNSLKLHTPGRTEVFKFMLTTQLEVSVNSANKFITSGFEFTSIYEFRDKVRSNILSQIDEYETIWRIGQVPEVVILKFKELQSERLALLLSDIDTITLLKSTGSYEEAYATILAFVGFLFKLSITTDALKTLDTLNGELGGLTFNGFAL